RSSLLAEHASLSPKQRSVLTLRMASVSEIQSLSSISLPLQSIKRTYESPSAARHKLSLFCMKYGDCIGTLEPAPIVTLAKKITRRAYLISARDPNHDLRGLRNHIRHDRYDHE